MGRQFKTWLVCQVCGRTVLKSAAAHWFSSQHRTYPDVQVVRCPQHWSEWALRNSVAGRTNEMRRQMREALAQPAITFPINLEPFPTHDVGDLPEWADDDPPPTDRRRT